MNPAADPLLLDGVTGIVSQAAAAILAVGDLATRHKEDRSPVTAADEAAQAVILAGLAHLAPDVPVVSEEAPAPAALGSVFFLVDPIDGTREFLAGRDDYTVNVALIDAGAPLLGVVAAPARQTLWRGLVGRGAQRMTLAPGSPLAAAQDVCAIRTRTRPPHPIGLVSRSHRDADSEAMLTQLGVAERLACGSSLKFCLLAQGDADFYPRLGPISEWDIAAGHAVVGAAGGIVVAPDGSALRYGNAAGGFRVGGFIACGDPAAWPKR